MSRNLFDSMGIESLESRTMMAGDVTAALAGGDLVLNGDDAGNEVVIRSTDQAGRFEIEGLNGTTINGQASVTIQGVDDDFRINLRNGDNALLITGEHSDGTESPVVIPDDLQIRTGNNNDTVVLDTVAVGGRTSVNTRGGNDGVIAFQSQFGDDFRANLGSGNDALGTDTVEFNGRLRASMGSGDDTIALFTTQFNDRVDVNTSSGNDMLGLVDTEINELRMNGGGDDDQLLINELSSVNEEESRIRNVEEIATDVDDDVIGDRLSDSAEILKGIELVITEGTV